MRSEQDVWKITCDVPRREEGCLIEGKKNRETPFIGQIKSDARVNIFKELKEKTRNRSECRIGVVDESLDEKKKRIDYLDTYPSRA